MKGYTLKSYHFVICTYLLLFCDYSLAWTPVKDPIAEKYAVEQYVYRPDARLEQYAYTQQLTPRLQEHTANAWQWRTAASQGQVNFRPWGNYDFSAQNKRYYAEEYPRAVQRYPYQPVVRDVARRYYQPYRYAGHQTYRPGYAQDYTRQYYPNTTYLDQGANRSYRLPEPGYVYSPIVRDPRKIEYLGAPYAYELY